MADNNNLSLSDRLGDQPRKASKPKPKSRPKPKAKHRDSEATRLAKGAVGPKGTQRLRDYAEKLDRQTQVDTRNEAMRGGMKGMPARPLGFSRNNVPQYEARAASHGYNPTATASTSAAVGKYLDAIAAPTSAAKNMTIVPGSIGALFAKRPWATGGGGVSASSEGDALPELPGLNVADYVGPYDQAADAARKAYDTARPDIEHTYANLVGQLQSGAADMAKQAGVNRQSLVDQLAASKASLDGFAAQAAGGQMVTDPTLTSRGAAQTAALAAAAQANADGRLGLADRFAEIQAQSSDSRQQDAGVAKSAALANASTNLQQLLNKIGVERAGAQQQFAKDSVAAQATAQKSEADVAKAKASAAADNHKLVEGAMTTPRQEFEAGYGDLVAQHPKGTQVFDMLTSAVKGSGPMAAAKALQLLESKRHDLENGTLAIDEDGTPIGARINVDKIAEWIKAFYDDKTKTLSARARAELQAQGVDLG